LRIDRSMIPPISVSSGGIEALPVAGRARRTCQTCSDTVPSSLSPRIVGDLDPTPHLQRFVLFVLDKCNVLC
jgi:hypothetical protein